MKKLFAVIITLIISTYTISQVQAQDDAFEDLSLNGMASYTQLRKEYYIGALYLESMSQDAQSVVGMPGRKRMEMRITIEKWSRRRFAQQWNQAILINNSQTALEEFAEQILAFTSVPREDLEENDRIIIDLDPDSGTTVYLNSQKMFNTSKTEFFDLILNTWIGQRPPSSEFKKSILTLPTDDVGTQLLTNYESITTSKSREKAVAGWLLAEKKEAEETAKADNPKIAPPGSGTKVTAKRSRRSSSTPKKTIAAAAVTAAVVAAPKPTLVLEKPTLGGSTSKASKTSTKPKAAPVKAKPKPKPIVIAKLQPKKPEIKKVSEKELVQEKLMKNYRSNVLKLTYLNTQYPRRAMDLKQEGLVVLKVTLSRKGKLLDVEPETSSKHNLLNKAARNAVKKSAPFPAAPSGLEGPKIVLSLPFNFKL